MINFPGKVFSRESIGKLIKIEKERSVDVVITRLSKNRGYTKKSKIFTNYQR